MSKSERGLPSLTHKAYWCYRGRCRNCQYVNQWVVDKGQGDYSIDTSLLSFHRYITENKTPYFIQACESCKAMTVYDLLAFSLR